MTLDSREADESPAPARTPAEAAHDVARGDRLDRIYRTWGGVRTRHAGKPPLELGPVALLIGMVSMLPLIPLDSALLGYAPDDQNRIFRFLDNATILGVITASFLLQSWCIESGLWALRPHPGSVRKWIRWLRPLMAGVPIVGLYVIPLWHLLGQRRPAWAFQDDRRASAGGLRRSRSRIVRSVGWLGRVRPRWFLALWSQLGLLFLGLLVTFCWAEWLWHSEFSSRRLQLVLGSFAFHVLGFVSMAYFFWQEGRGSSALLRGRVMPALSLLWLVPFPLFGMLGIFTIMFTSDQNRRDALAGQAGEAGGQAARWLGLKKTLSDSWGSRPWWSRLFGPKEGLREVPRLTESADKVFLFAQLKCILLFPEGAALTQGLLWLGDGRVRRFLDVVLLVGIAVAFVLGSVAALMAILRFWRRLVQMYARGLPYFTHLAAGHFSFLAGTFLGWTLDSQDQNVTGGILVIYGGVGASLIFLRPIFGTFLRLSEESPARVDRWFLWLLGFVSIAILGMGLANTPTESAELVFESIRIFVFNLVLLGVLLSVLLFRWILRPRRLTDIIKRNLPCRTRAELTFLAASALLPLGGLVAPAWLYLRRDFLE